MVSANVSLTNLCEGVFWHADRGDPAGTAYLNKDLHQRLLNILQNVTIESESRSFHGLVYG